MADFETEMATILAAITWTACTSQPTCHYGEAWTDGGKRDSYLRVKNDTEDIAEGLTYAGSIAYRVQRGQVQGSALSSTSRNNMITDLENGLGGQGVSILNKYISNYKNVYTFYMDLERIE